MNITHKENYEFNTGKTSHPQINQSKTQEKWVGVNINSWWSERSGFLRVRVEHERDGVWTSVGKRLHKNLLNYHDTILKYLRN